MNDHIHTEPQPKAPMLPPETPMDSGSQALSEALRSSFGIVKFVMFLLVCVFLGSGFFTVGPQERAIIIRLGKPVRYFVADAVAEFIHRHKLYL